MGLIRAGVLGWLLQRLLLDGLSLWGLRPPLFPALVLLAGGRHGPERGAALGLGLGLAALLAGAGAWTLPALSLLGGLGGLWIPARGRLWERWLRALPLLAGLEAAALLVHGPLPALLPLAGRELLLSLACLPLGELLLWSRRGGSPRRNRRGFPSTCPRSSS